MISTSSARRVASAEVLLERGCLLLGTGSDPGAAASLSDVPAVETDREGADEPSPLAWVDLAFTVCLRLEERHVAGAKADFLFPGAGHRPQDVREPRGFVEGIGGVFGRRDRLPPPLILAVAHSAPRE